MYRHVIILHISFCTIMGSHSNNRFFGLSLLAVLVFSLVGADASIRRGKRGAGMNSIDWCWRWDPNWAKDRQELAMCSAGFAGKMTNNVGPRAAHYVVTDAGDDPVKPRRGTLRYGATLIKGKVWITFQKDMVIKLQKPLLVSSFTVIDGRGADVQIAYGSCLLIYEVNDVIIHGLRIHHCRKPSQGPVLSPTGQINLGDADGDAIAVIGSRKIWIDHNTLSECHDGLLDITRGSTAITISNNRFHNHDKVMLLGHDDQFLLDRKMQVTVVFNHFGPNLNQRMPRVRHGYAHVANNFYQGWGSYALGGSTRQRVKSQGNYFMASNDNNKEVVWQEEGDRSGLWTSVNDMFANGAKFIQTESAIRLRPLYNQQQRFQVEDAKRVRTITRSAGAIRCSTHRLC